MTCCPYSKMLRDYYRANQGNSYIRIFNASPNSSAVDIYANDNLLIKNLAYKQFSNYIPITPSTYDIKVYPTGQTTVPISDANITIPANTIYNLVLIGTSPDISLFTVQEPSSAQNFGRACVRFIGLSPDAPEVDISLSDGTRVFHNVPYKGITDYACVPPRRYNFIIKSSGTNDVLATIPNVNLTPNTYYTIYTIGRIGASPPFEALLVTEPR